MEQQQDQAQQEQGPISREDVVAAIGDSDPWATNAKKLRAIIGRGSFGTIQKHLDAIRTQRKAAQVVGAVGEVPTPSRDAVDAIWRAAWSAAHVGLLSRLEQVTTERDALAAELASRVADHEILVEGMTEAEQAAEEARNAQAEAEALTQTLSQQRDSAAQSLQDAKAAAAAELATAQGSHAQALKEAALRQQVLQDTVDRAGQREGELRAQLQESQRQLQESQQRIDGLVAKLAELAAGGGSKKGGA